MHPNMNNLSCVGRGGKILCKMSAVTACNTLDVVFTAYADDMEHVEVFKCLGQLLSMERYQRAVDPMPT